MEHTIPDSPCRKCGGNTSIHFVKSTGMDITPTGMFRNCSRCGFSEQTQSLDEKLGNTKILGTEE